ncbi:hypothetical protein HOG11_03190 [bacterium]|mgnify:CR=1 FL=1|jgi:hypothetical protein|nr:hypothetical protein [bacterium]
MASLPKNITVSQNIYNKLSDENKYLGYSKTNRPMFPLDIWDENQVIYNDDYITVFNTENSLEIL